MSATYLDRRRDLLVCAFDAAAKLGMSADTVHDGESLLAQQGEAVLAQPLLATSGCSLPAGPASSSTASQRGGRGPSGRQPAVRVPCRSAAKVAPAARPLQCQ
jgi:hypothetical protein